MPKFPRFGFFFDIDGVLVRGGQILPGAREAFRFLVSARTGEWRVPVVFVTNAGNGLRHHKAEFLSEALQQKVKREQVVLSHSPLRQFKNFHNRNVLVSGQGPVLDIARNVGFHRPFTVDDLRRAYPMLDVVDHERRPTKEMLEAARHVSVPRMEAVVLFGEPVRWETNLQLILDLLLTDGLPAAPLVPPPYPHIPLIACNTDLVWMAQAPMKRFGHGSFLKCLESLYKKFTGYEIRYSAIVGKPAPMTYQHAEFVLQACAKRMGLPTPLKTIYCIGDNMEVDIYGANLYDLYLQRNAPIQSTARLGGARGVDQTELETLQQEPVPRVAFAGGGASASVPHPVAAGGISSGGGHFADVEEVCDRAEACKSILVQTGVYNSAVDLRSLQHHNHRDFPPAPPLEKPTFSTETVLDAVKMVLETEDFDF